MNQQTPHEIIIEITEEGEVKAQVEGVAGPGCGPLSEFLNALGVVIEDGETPDFYQVVTNDNEITTGW
jgi:hypothetical protein